MVRKLAQVALMMVVGVVAGCTTVQTVQQNIDADIQAILGRLHVDTQEFINHPERWGRVVDSLCSDGMITADQCVRLKAILKAREILVGGRLQESRVRPVDGVGELRRRFLHPPAKDKSSWSPSIPGEVKAGCEAGQNPQTRIPS